jgi:hypothetical protein
MTGFGSVAELCHFCSPIGYCNYGLDLDVGQAAT